MGRHAALTASESAVLAAGGSTVKGYLSVFTPPVVATCQVNGLQTYPCTSLVIDTISDAGAWATVKTGSTFKVHRSSTNQDFYFRMRKPPDATHIYPAEQAVGDSGLMPDNFTGIMYVDNDVITVYERFDLWSALPWLDYSGGVFTYKEDFFTQTEYEAAFGLYLNRYPPPQINIGPHRLLFTSGGTVAFDITCSYANWRAADAYTYDTITWILPAGLSLTGGSTTHDATIHVSGVAGTYIVECQVSCSGAGVSPESAYRVYVIADDTSGCIPIENISSDVSDMTGRKMTFTVNDNRLADLASGTMVLYSEIVGWAGVPGGTITVTPPGGSTGALGNGAGTDYERAQSFLVTGAGVLSGFTFDLGVNLGTPSGTLTWKICSGTDSAPGAVLATGTLTPTANATNTVAIGSGPVIDRNSRLWLWLRPTGAQTPGNSWQWKLTDTNVYADGIAAVSTDGGSAWIPGSVDLVCSLTTTAVSTVPSIIDSFAGWVIRHEATAEGGLRSGSFDLVGPAELLNRLGGYSGEFLRYADASCTDYSQLNPALANNNFLPWYLARLRAPMVTQLFDHHIWQTPPLAQNYYWGFKSFAMQPGTLLSQLQGLAAALGCNYGHDSTGAAWILPHPSFSIGVTYPRTSTDNVIRDTITAAKIASFQVSREYRPQTRKVQGLAMSYQVATNSDLPHVCEAPGSTPGQGTRESQTVALIAWNVYNTSGNNNDWTGYTGFQYANENNPYPSISMTMPYNYDVIEPAMCYFVAVNLTAGYLADNAAFARNIVVLRVSRQYADGTKTITIEAEAETWGNPGV